MNGRRIAIGAVGLRHMPSPVGRRGLTQTELGVRIGIKKGWMSGIEHGANITLDTLVRICRALGVESKLVIGDEVVELCDCEP